MGMSIAACKHQQLFYDNIQCGCRFVECEPEVCQLRLTDQDSFVVLASDGLWDVISDQEAVDCVQVRP